MAGRGGKRALVACNGKPEGLKAPAPDQKDSTVGGIADRLLPLVTLSSCDRAELEWHLRIRVSGTDRPSG
jgi:hypothetical protein